jgi:hypothetical protein
MNDFSKKTIAALARKGIRLVGLQAIPDMSSSMPFANATRGYIVDDNGTSRVLTFNEVLELAK